MILIFGGAFQGKTGYVITNYTVSDGQIYDCACLKTCENDAAAGGGDLLRAADAFLAVNHLEAWILRMIREGQDPYARLQEILRSGAWRDKAVICTDITHGVVPIDAEMRRWRDQTGRCLQLLAERADEVVRVFCGLGEHIRS